MDRLRYGRPEANEAGYNRQGRNAPGSPSQYANPSRQESRYGYVPPDEAYLGRGDLQNAEMALENVRIALDNARVPSNQPYPSDAVAFTRQGLQIVDDALMDVQMALASIRTPFQPQRHGVVGAETHASVEFNDGAPGIPNSRYYYSTTATVPVSTQHRSASHRLVSRHDVPTSNLPSSSFSTFQSFHVDNPWRSRCCWPCIRADISWCHNYDERHTWDQARSFSSI